MRGATARRFEPFAARIGAQAPNSAAEYDFVLGKLVDRATLAKAERLARQWGVHTHEVLVATGWVSAEDYTKALASDLGLGFRQEIAARDIDTAHRSTSLRATIGSGLIKQRGRAGFVLGPEHHKPGDVMAIAERVRPERLSLSPPGTLRTAVCYLMPGLPGGEA